MRFWHNFDFGAYSVGAASNVWIQQEALPSFGYGVRYVVQPCGRAVKSKKF